MGKSSINCQFSIAMLNNQMAHVFSHAVPYSLGKVPQFFQMFLSPLLGCLVFIWETSQSGFTTISGHVFLSHTQRFDET